MSDELTCPHCGDRLLPMAIPDGVQWDEKYHYVCFNDECSYYVEGWEWMEQQYGSGASYRYRIIDAEKKVAKPLAVWSADAHRDRILGGDDR
ncbi:MAG: hypothetical protein JRI23_07190 [Deltaproteobacteria bacterium]|nr:hypothetical protein [Deltaproteobacteria bacterium]MBW2531377.1 hypothetical protein [Deltaproteobacteria bacterium]